MAAAEPTRPREAALTALVWLLAAAYPFSFQAVFSSARLAQSHAAGLPLFGLALTWAFAGPLAAVVALQRMSPERFERVQTRALVCGALMAAVSPPLFVLVSRLGSALSPALGPWSWYAILALAPAVALVRWPRVSYPTARFVLVHRLSALVLSVFVLAHVVNQGIAFISLPAYAAMRNVLRVVSVQPALYTVVVSAVAIQMVTGAAVGMRKVRPGALAANLQAVSGWYLAAFLLTHVFTAVIAHLLHAPAPVTPVTATSAAQFNLLASPRAAAQLPFLVLGVAAFLFHVGVYARLAALAYLAEASVRRLSYAAMCVGGMVVVTVGLALCGVHLIR